MLFVWNLGKLRPKADYVEYWITTRFSLLHWKKKSGEVFKKRKSSDFELCALFKNCTIFIFLKPNIRNPSSPQVLYTLTEVQLNGFSTKLTKHPAKAYHEFWGEKLKILFHSENLFLKFNNLSVTVSDIDGLCLDLFFQCASLPLLRILFLLTVDIFKKKFLWPQCKNELKFNL